MPHAHNKELTDTGEREALGDQHVTRDALKVGLLKHESDCHERGPLHELTDKVDKIRLWITGASVIGFLATLAGPVILGWWLSTRLPAPQPQRSAQPATLINQAHASEGRTP